MPRYYHGYSVPFLFSHIVYSHQLKYACDPGPRSQCPRESFSLHGTIFIVNTEIEYKQRACLRFHRVFICQTILFALVEQRHHRWITEYRCLLLLILLHRHQTCLGMINTRCRRWSVFVDSRHVAMLDLRLSQREMSEGNSGFSTNALVTRTTKR